MTRICVPLMAPDCDALAHQVDAAQAARADMIELRLDFLQEWTTGAISRLMQHAGRFDGEIIATCRLASEGGRYHGDESHRISLLEHAGQGGADYIDVECEAWRASADLRRRIGGLCQAESPHGQPRCRLILSKHDFERTPADLDRIFADLLAMPAHVVKLACQAQSVADSLRMLDALRAARTHAHRAHQPADRHREIIALSMGETGIVTRVLAKKCGAMLTFASLGAGKESAPGQPTLHDLRELYRWDAIGPETRVYGVVGCPVGHSMSPAIHNAAFGATRHGGVYLPLRIEPAYEAFSQFLDEAFARPWLDLRGLSVTIPHKENLLRYVDEHGGEMEPLTRRIGVANTLAVETRDSAAPGTAHRLSAFNTDYRGAMDALCQGLGCTPADLAGMPVAVLGAGGVSRAIVAGLTDCGCQVAIYNRTAERAAELAAEFGATALPWGQRVRPGTRIIVNCTSIGMWPNTADSPLEVWPAGETPAVFDTVYNPIETRLLREARARGCVTIDGVAMFVGQAAAQFERWTGRPAPTGLMREVVVGRLRG